MAPDELSADGLEFFPVDIGSYRHHDNLDTATEVAAVAAALAPFAPYTVPWRAPAAERDAGAVEQRLTQWAHPAHPANTFLYWVGHGESNDDKALLAHAASPSPLVHSGVTPEQMLAYITARQNHPDSRDRWAVVVIDACRSDRFVELLSASAYLSSERPHNFLLVATSTRSTADLGAFSRALHTVLNSTFAADSVIDLRDLATELGRNLRDCPVLPHTSTGRALLRRAVPTAAGTITTTLDLLTEIQAVIDRLPPDEQRHFVPKAAGADLGEQSWHFEGREDERDTVLRWLDTAEQGLLTVTGAPGAGKSALLGHVLLHTRPHLRELLLRGGHLSPLPPGVPCPDDPFDAVLHLAGATARQTVDRLAEAAGLGGPPGELSVSERIGWLLDRISRRSGGLTLLLDALDEAAEPLVLAGRLIRPLAELPRVRVVVGTRRSTGEGPDLPGPARTDILDALAPPAAGDGPYARTALVVSRDPHAMSRYIRRRLAHATGRGDLSLQPWQIERAAVDIGHSGQEFLHARLAVHEILHDPAQVHDLAVLRKSTHRDLFASAIRRLTDRSPAFGPLLRALAFAQGRGLPVRDGVWATVAGALGAPSAGISDAAIHALTEAAAPYLVLDSEAGQTVYRLAHRTFTEFLTAEVPGHEEPHLAIAKALIATADAQPADTALNPYLVDHLAAHVALAGQQAWGELAGSPHVLDRTDVVSLVSEFMLHAFGRIDVPLAVAGTIATQHHAVTSPSADRAGLRELGMARTAGDYRPAATGRGAGTGRRDGFMSWSVRWSDLLPQPLHLTVHGHEGGVWAVVPFTAPDGRLRLATAADDRTVRLWDPLTGQAIGQPIHHEALVAAVVAFGAPDGRVLLASAGDSGTVHVWDPITGGPAAEHGSGHAGAVTAVAAFTTPDGRTLLATASDDRTVRLLDPMTGRAVGDSLTGHEAGVLSVAAFTGTDGRPLLASGSSDGQIRVWDALLGTPVGKAVTGHDHRIWALVPFHDRDGRRLLASGSEDRTVRVWDPFTGEAVGDPLTGHEAGVLSVAAFSVADGRPLLAAGGSTGRVRVADPLGSGDAGWPLTGHSGAVGAVAVFAAPDGRPLLATGSEDRTVRVWDPQADQPIVEPAAGHGSDVLSMTAFNGPGGGTLLATGHYSGSVRLWELDTGRIVGQHGIDDEGMIGVLTAFRAPDGRPLLALVVDGHTVYVRDALTGENVGQPLTSYGSDVMSLAVGTTAGGRPLLVTGTARGEIRIWDALTGDALGQPMTGHGDWVRAMRVLIAPDGRRLLATTGNDLTVRVWDLETQHPAGPPMSGHRSWVRALETFTNPDGRILLATAGNDSSVRIWDPLTGRAVSHLPGAHKGSVTGMVALRADGGTGSLLATGGADGTVRIWDPAASASWTLPLGVTAQAIVCAGRDLAVAGPEGLVTIRWYGHPARSGPVSRRPA
ncbi:WD40 repeat domain-containing protein [Actinacidiphila acididurans]|uniref:WD40 repeat protein n=1 Tax=Actinacidiphila acididurans TaxID=2784346 RepID=A0ABS2TVQ7_9ACTN|nr:WD40 repeat domain-containing protein [Actinacidiphila acididurans]MBM9507162.1 hypothetical protein [Actinacidiphila acididurans]